MHRKSDGERVSFFLTAFRWRGNVVNAEPDLCDDLSWHSVRNLPDNMVPYVRQGLENYLNGRFYDSFGWD